MTTVLYIAGTGRSGSTLVERVIARAPGAVAVGEVRLLWSRGLIENRLCGCGEPVGSCPFWTAVLEHVPATTAATAAALDRVTRLRHLLGRRPDPSLSQSLSRLYDAIATVSGADVIVDASKLPSYADVLDRVDALDVRVLHLVRDPRGAAHSWRRSKALPEKGDAALMEQRSAAKSAALWLVWNALASRRRRQGGRYTCLRYEDFVADPSATLMHALAGLGLSHLQVPLARNTIELGVDHTAAGNPDRLKHGVTEIRADEKWRTEAPRRDQLVVTALAAPLMRRYRYPLRPGRS